MQDYQTPAGKVLSRDLTAQLNTAIQFLVACRPLSVPMGNAIKFVKLQVGCPARLAILRLHGRLSVAPLLLHARVREMRLLH